MANLRETSIWEAGIYQLETSDPVMGGENGIDNRAPRQLANRTLWLKNELARQIGLVNQNAADLSNQKADKSVQFTAGNGLIGGGDFSTSRSLALGTPSKITATTTNTAVSNTHSHEIDKASTTTAGIVQLADTLTSSATHLALTAHQGKVLKGQIDSKLASNANAVSATKLHTAHTINGVAFDGTQDITITDDTKVSKLGDVMSGALKFTANTSAMPASEPFAISHRRVQSYSAVYINANTDNSGDDEPVLSPVAKLSAAAKQMAWRWGRIICNGWESMSPRSTATSPAVINYTPPVPYR